MDGAGGHRGFGDHGDRRRRQFDFRNLSAAREGQAGAVDLRKSVDRLDGAARGNFDDRGDGAGLSIWLQSFGDMVLSIFRESAGVAGPGAVGRARGFDDVCLYRAGRAGVDRTLGKAARGTYFEFGRASEMAVADGEGVSL